MTVFDSTASAKASAKDESTSFSFSSSPPSTGDVVGRSPAIAHTASRTTVSHASIVARTSASSVNRSFSLIFLAFFSNRIVFNDDAAAADDDVDVSRNPSHNARHASSNISCTSSGVSASNKFVNAVAVSVVVID